MTLPSLLAQSSFLAAGGGAYPFSKWLFVGLGVGAVVVAAVAWWAVGRDAGLGLASMVIASGLGYAALLFAARSTAAPMLSYYPLKFAWLAGLILFLTMIGMTAGILSTWSRRWPVGAIGFVVLAAVSLAVLQFAPSNTTGYPIRNPLVRILAGDFIGSGDSTARRIFRYADLTAPTLLVSSKDPEEAEIDFWVLQMQANAVAGDATLRSAAYGVYDLGKTDDLCAVLGKIDAPVTILTSDAGLQQRIDQRCADPRVHVRQIAAG